MSVQGERAQASVWQPAGAMPPVLLRELLPEVSWQGQKPAAPITQLAYNSAQVRPGSLFAAWQGRAHDGHAFVADAIERGAVAILCERPVEAPPQVAQAVVCDVRHRLAQAAQRYYQDPGRQLVMAAVTGTNGKTTCVQIMRAILTAAKGPAGSMGTLGATFAQHTLAAKLTTPESVDVLRILRGMHSAGAWAVAMEASSQALVQHRLDGVRFDVGVFTNLTQDHLDDHGSMAHYFAAKCKLFAERLKPTGAAVFNLDDPTVAPLRQRYGPQALGFSLYANHPGKPEVVLRSAALRDTGTRLSVDTPLGVLELHSVLCGRFNVANILACVTAALALGLDAQAITAGVAAAGHIDGRLQRISGPGQPLVLVDYAHTPDALSCALRTVRELCSGRLGVVFGCGGERDPSKRAAMGAAAALAADWGVVSNDNPRREDPQTIARAVCQGIEGAGRSLSTALTTNSFCLQLDRHKAIFAAVANCGPGDALLIAGKGHETYQMVGTQVLSFDDRLVAQQALQAANTQATGGKDA